ncbi:MAG: TonB-dependent receptor [Pyrinomonadaceae bacterium]|nr:TonB-dependent receptor [Pyrinomonadaceae bacterium]
MTKSPKNIRTLAQGVLTGFILPVVIALVVAQSAFAQGSRGTVSGTVSDQTGGVIPNATVSLVDVEKGRTVTTQTNDQGNYRFIEVEPSVYTVIVKATGFADFKRVNFKVEPNRNVTVDAQLSVGSQVTEVSVSAGEELIDRESATLGTTVDGRRVVGLPLNGRNVLNLTLLQPGTAPAGGGFGSGLGVRVNGSRGVENNVTLDGGNNNEVAVGGTIGAQPRPDAVQEFRLLTSNFEAEFGRNTGSIINVVTKSGGNEFHGNGRFFYRPTELSASRYLDKALSSGDPNEDLRRKFDRKEYGFNIGGPIYFLNTGSGGPAIYDGRDRTFFFVDFERRWQNVGATQTISGLPTAAERMGDFSTDVGRSCPGGGSGICDPMTGNPFPGGIIPQNRFSPIAQYYLGFIPTGNSAGQAQVGADQLTINNYLTIRGDHNFNENHLVNFTFNYFDSDDNDPFAFGGSAVPGFGSADRRKSRNHVARYTWAISNSMANYLLVNISKNKQPGVAPVNTTTPEEIGFTADFVASREFVGPPAIRLFDRLGLRIGNSIQGPQARVSENYQIQDSFTWVTGKHRLKFGVDGTKYKQGQDFVFINQGFLTFSGRFGNNTTGDDLADLIIGNSPIAAQYGAAGRRDFRQLAFAGFAQDNWNVARGLTLSMGLRYEYTSPLKDLQDRVAYYRPGATSTLLAQGALIFEGRQIVAADPNNLPNGLVYVGDPDPVLGGTVPRGGVRPDKNNFAPRLGFAYSIPGSDSGILKAIFGDQQSVIRGAIGMYYGAIIGDTALQQLTATGYNGTNAFFFPNGGTLADPFAPDPYPGFDGVQPTRPNPFLSTDDIIIPSVLNQAAQPIDPLLKTPYTIQWNFTFERPFQDDYIFGISYVGNRGKHQYVREQINPAVGTLIPVPAGRVIPTPSTSNSNSRRLNSSYAIGLNLLTAAGSSQYDSMQVNFQKRFSPNGLTFQAAYTFSKSINDADTQRGGLDIINRRIGRGLSGDDVPHRFVGSFTYEIPFFNNTTGFLNRVLTGWEVNGIYTYQSGTLIAPGNPIDTVGTGGGVVSGADLGTQPFQTLDPQSNDRYGFNPEAFQIADCGTNFELCGGVGRRGTATGLQFRLDNPANNFDVALVKKTRLFSESNNLELRLEAFNAFNTTQFTTINTNLNNLVYNTPGDPSSGVNRELTSFGRYTNTREARIIQLGVRLSF